MADSVALISGIAAAVSALVAVLYSRSAVRASRDQAKAAMGANDFARQIGQSEAVIHFTGRFFDLLKDGPDFGNRTWEYQFWSLQATEFYFFDNSWIPDFMYQLWMVELASMYCREDERCRGDDVRESHSQYLRTYSANYREMCKFFYEIQDVAMKHRGDAALRNEKVADTVERWPKKVPASSVS